MPYRRFQSVLALLLCLLLLVGCNKTTPQQEPEAEQTITADDWNNTVATFGDHTLTSVGFSYFYWASYMSFLNYYGSEAGNMLDLYTPLDQQMYTEDLTWQDYFIENALMAFRQFCTLNDLAEADGFALSETAQNALKNGQEDLMKAAQGLGFESVEDYLKANYGEGASYETFIDYKHDDFVVQEYTAKLQSLFEFTDQEVEDYYDKNAETYEQNGVMKEDVKMAQVRCLMVLPEEQTDEDYAVIDDAFDEMLADWENWEDHSEQGFMSFGEKWSEKGFAQDYLDAVAPGTLDFSFMDEWLFDEPRSLGDTRTYYKESGDYLFFYVGQREDIFWRTQTKFDMQRDAFTTFLLENMSSYEYQTYPENIIISEAEDLYGDITSVIDTE